MNAKLNEFLSRMGLTEYEAKTLATLFSLKEADAPEVSRTAQVPKTRVYDVLDKLVEKELAIKIFSRPKKYRAMDAPEVFEKLVRAKKDELDALENHSKILGNEIVQQQMSDQKSTEERVLKVKTRTDFYKILSQEMDSAEKEIIGLTRLDVHHPILHDSLRKASGRDVTVRLIGEHPEAFKEAGRRINGVRLKDSQHGMHAYVIDGRKVIMLLSDMKKEKPEYHFAIWPENKSLAQTIQNRFVQEWGADE
jgi:sugar-specific transcriptional regulator TrmB